jgi:3-methyladenine DNA glycosylase AlkC
MAYKKLKYWFDKDLAILLAGKIRNEYEFFDSNSFIDTISRDSKDLELKDRVELIADQLHKKLPDDYSRTIDILVNILGPENENETGMFTQGYWIMPIALYVEKYGLNHFTVSIEAIKEITKRNTGEYCIRPYLEKYPEKALNVMKKWSLDENVHVRRLSSEGLRPRLPWAKKLQQFIDDPGPVIDVIESLKDDDSKFVGKSVANNLNDILKDNYSIGISTIRKWAEDATKQRQWILKHALRNLLKRGDVEALRIVGDFF